jgi:hypothetical protein
MLESTIAVFCAEVVACLKNKKISTKSVQFVAARVVLRTGIQDEQFMFVLSASDTKKIFS